MELDRRILLGALAATAATPALGQPAQPAPAATKVAKETTPLAARLAAYVDAARVSDLDAATIERVKVHVLDSLGCGLAAFKEKTVSAVRELAFANGGNGATVIGTKRRATLEWAAFANAAAVRADDINDVYVGKGTGHPSDNIAPCLTVAEAANAPARTCCFRSRSPMRSIAASWMPSTSTTAAGIIRIMR